MKNVVPYLIVFALASSLFSCKNETPKEPEVVVEKDTIVEEVKNMQYGFDFNKYQVTEGKIKDNWTLSHLLLPFGIGQNEINIASRKASDSLIGLKYIVPNKQFYVLSEKGDTNKLAKQVIYVKNKVDYFVFDFNDSVRVTKHSKPVEISERMITGEIVQGSNLTFAINQELENIALTYELSESIAGIYAWAIDFFKLHAGDNFKIIVDEKRVDGELVGLGEVKAVWFDHHENPYYSFQYYSDTSKTNQSYYDENGKQMKRPFLMAPVKYSRISSGFTKRRYHPVQKRWKAHKGTDYAAPKGTPIFSTADGYVVAATRSKFNGNYVKVKHNDTYTTQYLHMSKIGEGIKKGVHVKQGQTIGYVGSTGLATGPHVCYRFWKNGEQVNHRALKFPNNVPMPKSMKPAYLEFIEPIKSKLDSAKVRPYLPSEKDTL